MIRTAYISLAGILHRLRIAFTPERERLRQEAQFWGKVDIDQARRVSWTSIECLGRMAVREMTTGRWEQLMDVVIDAIRPADRRHLIGLTLGCGDMQGEHGYFIHRDLPFERVDAYDISVEAMERGRRLTDSLGLNVQYRVADINDIRLPPEEYDLAVVSHSMHHFRRIEHIVDQIAHALKPGGLLVLWDYVGPRFQRFTRRQLKYANLMLKALPSTYRRLPAGRMCERITSQPWVLISPDEAPRSDRILPALRRMHVLYQYNWAGLLYPLLRGGLAVNFDQNNSDDYKIIDCLFQLDRLLCQSGQIEPNFSVTIAARDGYSRA